MTFLLLVATFGGLGLLGWVVRRAWQNMPVEPPSPTPFSRSQQATAEAARAWDGRHPRVQQMTIRRRGHYPPRRQSIEE